MNALTRLGMAALIGVSGATSVVGAAVAAEEQTIAVYRVSLTDPDTGNVAYVDRKSIRSWAKKEDCEAQKETFSGYHTNAVEDFDINTADGKPHTVKLVSITCGPQT